MDKKKSIYKIHKTEKLYMETQSKGTYGDEIYRKKIYGEEKYGKEIYREGKNRKKIYKEKTHGEKTYGYTQNKQKKKVIHKKIRYGDKQRQNRQRRNIQIKDI